MNAVTGNRKLPFACVNFTSGTDCPSRPLGLCQLDRAGIPGCSSARCYARADERYMPDVLRFRRRQALAWAFERPERIAGDLMAAVGRSGHDVVRLSVAGDLPDPGTARKLAAVLALIPASVAVYGYTCRRDILDAVDLSRVRWSGSGFPVNGREYRLVPPDYMPRRGEVLCSGDCHQCSACYGERPVRVVSRFRPR